MQVKVDNIAIVEPNSNRCIAIVDEALAAWFKQQFPVYNQVEIESIGSMTFRTAEGYSISAISIHPVGKPFSKDAYYMITSKPEEISLGKAWEYILPK